MPPIDPLMSAEAKAASIVAASVVGDASKLPSTMLESLGRSSVALSVGGGGPDSVALAGDLSSGGTQVAPRTASQSKGGSADVSSIDAGAEPYRGGRCLCRLADPVMGLIEFREMLEEMDVVPHLVTRQDAVQAFRAVLQASMHIYPCLSKYISWIE